LAQRRHLLNRLSAHYVLPYFDVGIRLDSDGMGGIVEACRAVQSAIQTHGTTHLPAPFVSCNM
jgi:hypothetical protein